MDESTKNLHARIAHLEQTVADLQRGLNDVRAAMGVPQQPQPPVAAAPTQAQIVPAAPIVRMPPLPAQPASPVSAPRSFNGADVVRGGEYWFSRIGIGLFLLGLAFLFKYAIDQGWLTPLVRVGIGLGTGVLFLALGLWLRSARPHFAAILQGGGIAAWYITDFAAFQFYELVSYPLAFGFMCAVTALTFGLAVWQNKQVLAIIAALGGFATPFVLYTDTGSVAGLVGYSSLILSGIAAICVYHRWRPLLWVGVVSGWLVLLSAVLMLPFFPEGRADRWAVTLGIVWISLLFWPLVVALLHKVVSADTHPLGIFRMSATDLGVTTFVTPFLAFGLTAATWDFTKLSSGWLALALAGVATCGWWLLRRALGNSRVVYAHAGSAVLLLTTALLLLLEGNVLLLALAVEATALHWLAGRQKDWFAAGFAHLLFAALMLVMLESVLLGQSLEPAFFNTSALTNAAILGLGFGASWLVRPRAIAPAYWLVVHLLLLGTLRHELLPLRDGNGYITIVWGVYGIGLLLVGLRWDRTVASLFGMGTLLLVVAKLLIVDLASVAAIWRILLFLGFGILFLLVGYALRALWRPKALPASNEPTAG